MNRALTSSKSWGALLKNCRVSLTSTPKYGCLLKNNFKSKILVNQIRQISSNVRYLVCTINTAVARNHLERSSRTGRRHFGTTAIAQDDHPDGSPRIVNILKEGSIKEAIAGNTLIYSF